MSVALCLQHTFENYWWFSRCNSDVGDVLNSPPSYIHFNGAQILDFSYFCHV